ncbi:MAG: uridine kinase [Lachnospiraceae bacterium]|nr:uridine kinase [Lachnospiraceae bacterium]
MNDILIVGIAGGSGSGKTTLTNNLISRFGDQVTVVHHDNYYRSHHDLTYEERTRLNYDCPEAFENELMIEQLGLLKEGRSVECPIYDFTVHDRKAETITIEPKPVILVEGILIFTEPALLEQMDIKIFVDTDADIRLARRIRRDVEDRGRSMQSVLDQWCTTVKPMYEMYVEPTKKKADIIVPEGGRNQVALDMLFGRLERHLKEIRKA